MGHQERRENEMSMYDRFSKDCSDEIFNSIYSDFYDMAIRDNKARYEAVKRKKDYRPGEHTCAFNDFCHGRMSIGDALDYIRLNRQYEVTS